MKNKKTTIVERLASPDIDNDFNPIIGLILTNKIDYLVHNATKVNTATSQIHKKGIEI